MNRELLKLCLVTDRKILGEKDIVQAVEESIEGGVTMVQLREKDATPEEFYQIALRVKAITDRYSIPLIINDDVLLADKIDAAGVHIGQNDMEPGEARKILGDKKIIGVSVSSMEEIQNTDLSLLDYVGVGPIFPTLSKGDASEPMGLENLKKMAESYQIPMIGIGGIEADNIAEIIHAGIDGAALITGILADKNISSAAKNLREEVDRALVMREFKKILENTRENNPLVYNLTNSVTMNDCANVTLAVGASPLMSFCLEEMEEILSMASSVVINIGTMEPHMREMALEVGKIANRLKKPIVLDPVGAGASKVRKKFVEELLENVKFHVVKGNLAEIKSLLNLDSASHGVDSLETEDNGAEVGRLFYEKYGTTVAITGKVDYIVHGSKTIAVYNGDEKMRKITGTGCMTASIIGGFLSEGESFWGASLGIISMGISGEIALENSRGLSSFKIELIDALSNITLEEIQNRGKFRCEL